MRTLTSLATILLFSSSVAFSEPVSQNLPLPPPQDYATDLPPAAADPPCSVKGKKSKKTKKLKRSSGEAEAPTSTSIPPNAQASIQTPKKAASMESKTIYDYMPDAIYRLYGAPLHIVDVQLQPGETLTGKVAAGDTVRWTVGVVVSGSGSEAVQHVLIKPNEAGLETNFIITTDRHSYHLAAKSEGKFYIPTIGWSYPQEEWNKLQAQKAEEKRLEDQVTAPALKAENLNFKYRIEAKEDYPWKPLRVFDDGQKTFIQMNPRMKNYEAPVLFIKGKEGLNLVNYRVKGDYFVVDRLFDEAQMRSGKDQVVEIEAEKKRGFWSFLPWVK